MINIETLIEDLIDQLRENGIIASANYTIGENAEIKEIKIKIIDCID